MVITRCEAISDLPEIAEAEPCAIGSDRYEVK